MDYDHKTFPHPVCPGGYPWGQIEQILDEETFREFKFWMSGQTMMLCDGRKYNHELRVYETDECAETPHGGVVYPYDLHRFLGFLGEQQYRVWD